MVLAQEEAARSLQEKQVCDLYLRTLVYLTYSTHIYSDLLGNPGS